MLPVVEQVVMDRTEENRLLRLAMARGLLHWEDLDAVADRLAAGEAGPGDGWLAALIEAGRLDPQQVEELAAELTRDEHDRTPDLGTGTAAAVTSPTRTASGAGPAPAGVPSRAPRDEVAALAFGPEYQFLAGWERYRIERFLGAGGMGSVFKAWDPALDRPVALKFLHRDDPTQTARFLREARSQARVEHPHICQVFEVGEVAGRPYIAMQYIAGRSLSEVRDRLSLEAQVRLVQDVALAVHAAHRTGLVHRDLKPGNVLLGTDEAGGLHPWVVDFGLAQTSDEPGITRTGLISGTPAYISPEQAEGKPLDRRSDIYSLGVVLYELLAGRPPFAGANPTATLLRVLSEEPPRLRRFVPAIPADLETVVMKCLERDPERRYGSARELAEDLGRYLDGEPVQARPVSWAYRAAKRLQKHRMLAVVGAAAGLAILLLAGWALRAQWQSQEKAELAQRFGQRVQRLESDLRSEAAQPLHDITPRKEQIRRELTAIAGEMQRLGALAEGPGHAALGRGYLALHQDELAAEHLEKAWQAGERGPDVAVALGRVVGILGQKEKALAAAGPRSLAARAEITRTYNRPALVYLKEGLAGAEADPYLAALIARYEERFDEALALARKARERSPEAAAQLEAEIYADQADLAAAGGRTDEALRLYDQAGAVYRDLLLRIPSDAALHAADCRRRGQRMAIELRLGSLPVSAVEEALAACDRALAIDRGLSEALALKADILTQRADAMRKRGEDPEEDLRKAIELAERATRFNRRDDLARVYLSFALRVLGEWQQGRGQDASVTLERAVAVAEEAVGIRPDSAGNHSALGTSHLMRARLLQARGVDPTPEIERGAASYDQALVLNPRYLPALINLANAWHLQAETDAARGQDPSAAVGKAVAALNKAAALDPNRSPTFNNLGNAHLTLAEYQLARGTDAEPSLTRADESYRRALALKHPYAPYNLAWTQRSLALSRLVAGRDPSPALVAAQRYLAQARELNPNDFDVFLEEGRVELLAARWAAQQGRDPLGSLEAAGSALARAAVLNPESADVPYAQALVELQRADWERERRPAEAAAAVRRGLDFAARALDLNSGDGSYLAAQGNLELRAAKLAASPELRRERATRAVASLEKALAANPLLRREHGRSLAEARGLASV